MAEAAPLHANNRIYPDLDDDRVEFEEWSAKDRADFDWKLGRLLPPFIKHDIVKMTLDNHHLSMKDEHAVELSLMFPLHKVTDPELAKKQYLYFWELKKKQGWEAIHTTIVSIKNQMYPQDYYKIYYC